MTEFDNLSKEDRDTVWKAVIKARSLIQFIEQDGFSIPDEIAVMITVFDRTEKGVFAEALFDWIFRGVSIKVNEEDNDLWHWLSEQSVSLAKSLLCYLVRNAEGAIAS